MALSLGLYAISDAGSAGSDACRQVCPVDSHLRCGLVIAAAADVDEPQGLGLAERQLVSVLLDRTGVLHLRLGPLAPVSTESKVR